MTFAGYSFDVHGTPAPKGSNRAILIRGQARLIPGGSSANQKALNAWAKAIKERTVEVVGKHEGPIYGEQPLEVHLLFKLVRPKSNRNTHPCTMNRDDIDKLTRSTLDALTGLLYDDDSRIVVLQACKQWAPPEQEGVVITVRTLEGVVVVGDVVGDVVGATGAQGTLRL